MNKEEEGKKKQEMIEDNKSEKGYRKKGKPTLAEQLAGQRSSSTNSISDLSKRKREDEERVKLEEELREKFEKTRRIGRSPLQRKEEKESQTRKEEESQTRKEGENKMKRDEQFENIMAMLREMREELKEIPKIRQEINEWKEEAKKKDKK